MRRIYTALASIGLLAGVILHRSNQQGQPASYSAAVAPQVESDKVVQGSSTDAPSSAGESQAPLVAPPSASPDSRPDEWVRFSDWLARWQASDAAGRASLEAEGVQIAEERSIVLRDMMQSSPKRAFELAIPLRDYVTLPASVQAKVETPFNVQTSYDPLRRMAVTEQGICAPATPIPGEQDTPNGKVVLRSGNAPESETYSFGGRIAAYPGKESTTIFGYSLNGRQVIGENSIQRLDPADIEAAVQLFGESSFGRFVSPITGGATDSSIAAVYGGSVHWFESKQDLAKAESLLSAIDTSINPKPITRYFDQFGFAGLARGTTTEWLNPTTYPVLVAFAFNGYSRSWSCAPKKVFVGVVKYTQDGWDTNQYVPVVQGITSGVDKFIQDISRGQSQFNIVMAPSALVLDKTAYPNESEALLNKMKDYYQTTMGGNPDQVDIWTSFVETTNGGAGYSGRGLAGAWKCWITDSTAQGLWCHEYGHCYGLPHASAWVLNAGVTDPLSLLGAHNEYGDQMDVMGNGTYPQGYWRMHALWSIGWRDDAEYPEITTPGVYNIYRYDYPNMGNTQKAAGNPLTQGILVRRSGVADQLLSLSHRSSYSYLPTIGKGLQIVRITEDKKPGWYDTTQSHMLDLTPSTSGDNKDGGLPIGKTFYDSVGGISITPLALKGTAPNVYVETDIKFGPFTGNHAPTGLTLTVPSTGTARSNIDMSATASDSDGDSLAYHWNFGDGTFADSAAAAQTKNFTAGGDYTVSVTVTDKKGGTASATANISVADPLRTVADQTLPSFAGGYIKRLRSLGDSLLFALCSSGRIYKTTDASSWSLINVPAASTVTFTDAAKNDSGIVVLGTDASSNVRIFKTTDSGLNWTAATVPAGSLKLTRLTWTGSKFIAAAGDSANNYVLASSDGLSWTKTIVATPKPGQWRSIASDGNGAVLMTGDQNAIVCTAYSSDHGATWSTFTADLNARGEDCTYFNGDFYTGGWNTNIAKVTGNGRVFTTVGQIKSSTTGLFISSNASFAIAKEAITASYGLQLSSNGTDWFKITLDGGNRDIIGADVMAGYLFMIQQDIVGGYAYYKIVRTTTAVANSFTNPTDDPSAPPTITSHPASRAANPGASTTFSVHASGASPFTYQWKKDGTNISGATASSYTIASVATSHAGDYSVVVSNANGSATSNAATLTINTAVTITQQPVDTAVNPGSSFSLSVTATGSAPITYQWKKDGSAISGATSATYTVASAASSHAGNYTVVVTNPVGSVTSSAAAVMVRTAPVILTHPLTQSFNAGATITLSVSASGSSPFSYQWYKGTSAIPGATASTYTLTSAQASDAGGYKVVVTNALGTATSNTATLTLNIPVTITQQPVGANVSSGAPFTLRVTASGSAPITYQWKKDGTSIPGATTASYTVASATSSHAGSYTVVVTNPAGSVTSTAAAISVGSAPAITTHPLTQGFNSGSSVTLTVSATGLAPLSYQWYKNNVAISGATSATYTLASAQPSNAGSYKVTVTNAIGSVTSNTAVLTLNIAPTITSQPASLTVRVGSQAILTVVAAGTAPFTYQWKKGGTSIPGATAATYTITSSTTSNAGTYTVVVTNAAGSVTSNSAALTVQAPPSITVHPASATVLLGSALNLSVTATGPGSTITYQWFRDGTAIPGATASTYVVAASTASNWGIYHVNVSNALGTVTSNPAMVQIDGPPVITLQPVNTSITATGTATLKVNAVSATTLTYYWKKNGTQVTQPASITGGPSTVSFTLTLQSSGDASPAGSYTLVLSNSRSGVTPLSSTAAVVTDLSPPKLLTYKLSNSMSAVASLRTTGTTPTVSLRTAYNTERLIMDIRSSGTTTYQWSYQSMTAKSFTNIAGATASTLDFNTLASTLKGKLGTFQITATNANGSTSCKFLIASFSNPPPPTPSPTVLSVQTQPSAIATVEGNPATFSWSTSGSPATIAWYKFDSGGSMQLIPGNTTTTFRISSVTFNDDGTYMAVATDAAGNTVCTQMVTLTVMPKGE